MTNSLIWVFALAGAVAIFIVACVIAWAFIQEIGDDK
jgi:hypothetical protein